MLSTTKKQRKQINDGVDQGNLCQLYFFTRVARKNLGERSDSNG